MPLDREYVVAAYCGMLHSGLPTDAFVAKYGLSDSERRRAAIAAIQMLMQRFYVECWDGSEAAQRVRTVAARHGIREVELEHMAWEVLRGAVETSDVIGETSAAEVVNYVVRYFLLNRLPVKTRFGFGDCFDLFQPKAVPPGSEQLRSDAVGHTTDGSPTSQYPPEALELLRDAGIAV